MKNNGIVLLTCILLFSCLSVEEKKILAQEYHNLGSSYFELKKYDKAEAAFLKAISLDETQNASQYNLAIIKIQNNKYDEAKIIIDSLIEKDSENTKVLTLQSFLLYKTGNIDDALVVNKKILLIIPHDPEATYNYAVLLCAKEKYLEARDFFIELLTFNSSDVPVIRELAKIEKALGNFEGSIAYYENLLSIKSDDMTIKYDYVLVLIEAKSYAKALEVLESILKIQNNNNQALFKKAELQLIAVQDQKAGFETLKLAVSNGFNDKDQIKKLVENPLIKVSEEIKTYLGEQNLLDNSKIESK